MTVTSVIFYVKIIFMYQNIYQRYNNYKPENQNSEPAVVKASTLLGEQNVYKEREIQYFDRLISESEFYDRLKCL